MKKQHLILLTGLILTMVFTIGTGCNNQSEDSKTTEIKSVDAPRATDATNQSRVVVSNQDTVSFLDGKLDSLWLTATDFKKLGKSKAVFIFHFDQSSKAVLLDGWKDKGGSTFNIPPDAKLNKGNRDPKNYGPGLYYGNLVMKNMNAVQTQIDNNGAQLVIFAPFQDGNHIGFKIFLSKETSMAARKDALIPTSGIANPSPPKTF